MPDFEDFGSFEDFGATRGGNDVPSVVFDGTPIVVCLIPDLFFATRFVDVIAAHGRTAGHRRDAGSVCHRHGSLLPGVGAVDLNTPGEWADAIRRCKQRPHTSQIPIFAFGSHVDVETLKAARQAGADHAWARSRMMDDLPDVVARHVDPPLRALAGCDDGLSEQALLGVEAFNRRDYFEQHEHFEAAWLAEERPVREVYQGILQIGVAFLQIERSNWAGAVKIFRRGLPRLRALPPRCLGIDIVAFRRCSRGDPSGDHAVGFRANGRVRSEEISDHTDGRFTDGED